ncbi:hypothetical protein NEOLEDRAFT_1054896 [Neolentinus lepideus HHB14362 ss-1]|uniref:Integrase core domain-containing protein n=1 Tax=Neolentinus lepideus HHB14362 ss-1 TaxID=1314782 RepID=A0A165VWE3_9AGAM|nr:hypothetical protein NEOLEDRAFT_1054896 [Neolentinus lepideus HHB14362 ss-1]
MILSSTRNTRIERLWVEVGSQFGRHWRGFFTRLERLHHMDASDPAHLWLLHTLFLCEIRKDCENFQQDWNHHPLSGEGDQTPSDLRFLGQARHGVYSDDYDNVHPDVLNQYYGADSTRDARGQNPSGAGHSDEEDVDTEDLQERISHEQVRHVRHEPVAVPLAESPFSEDITELFLSALQEVRDAEVIPEAFGVLEQEWDDVGYPESEPIRSGRKYIDIPLPFAVWWPRAVSWVQGLSLLSHFQNAEDELMPYTDSDEA